MPNSQKIISGILAYFPYTPTADQELLISQLAVFVSSSDPNTLFLLKGYAGTGKTTIVSSLVNVMTKISVKPVLLAPTGRAAKVLASYSSDKAYTIHKKIYRIYAAADGSIQVALQPNRHKNTLFIVDEASMISPGVTDGNESLFGGGNLLDDLIAYVYSGKNCRLILIGDTAQLPPVDSPESRALDIAYMRTRFHRSIVEFELKEVMRQAHDSGILSNATLLRSMISDNTPGFPQFIIDRFNDFIRPAYDLIVDEINSAFQGRDQHEALIICRSNKRANMFNQNIRQRVLFMDDEINSGDLLMAVKNNYYWLPETSDAGFIANGDIMEIKRIRKIESLYGFRFADISISLVDYPEETVIEVKVLLDTLELETPSLDPARYKMLYNAIEAEYSHIENHSAKRAEIMNNPYLQALQVKFAYALTCHKAQGGQWKYVFIDMGYIPGNMPDIAYLRWLYTAITRATKKVYMLNFTNDFFK